MNTSQRRMSNADGENPPAILTDFPMEFVRVKERSLTSDAPPLDAKMGPKMQSTKLSGFW
jgi:hypothetical protein